MSFRSNFNKTPIGIRTNVRTTDKQTDPVRENSTKSRATAEIHDRHQVLFLLLFFYFSAKSRLDQERIVIGAQAVREKDRVSRDFLGAAKNAHEQRGNAFTVGERDR